MRVELVVLEAAVVMVVDMVDALLICSSRLVALVAVGPPLGLMLRAVPGFGACGVAVGADACAAAILGIALGAAVAPGAADALKVDIHDAGGFAFEVQTNSPINLLRRVRYPDKLFVQVRHPYRQTPKKPSINAKSQRSADLSSSAGCWRCGQELWRGAQPVFQKYRASLC